MTIDEHRPGTVAVQLGTDHVAVVEFARPPNNFFNVDLLAALADALESLAADGAARAIVMRGRGKHFCAGADFSGGGGRDTDVGDLYGQALRLFRQPLPVVTAIQGAAIGGGLGLALVADFRVAGPEARFAANFAELGIHQGFGLSVTLPSLIGQQHAIDLLYTGRRIGSEEARRLGLVDQVTTGDQLLTRAHSLAAQIASSAPLAVRSIRSTMRGHLVQEVARVLAHERSEQEALMASADFQEGIAAASTRRMPRFSGN